MKIKLEHCKDCQSKEKQGSWEKQKEEQGYDRHRKDAGDGVSRGGAGVGNESRLSSEFKDHLGLGLLANCVHSQVSRTLHVKPKLNAWPVLALPLASPQQFKSTSSSSPLHIPTLKWPPKIEGEQRDQFTPVLLPCQQRKVEDDKEEAS